MNSSNLSEESLVAAPSATNLADAEIASIADRVASRLGIEPGAELEPVILRIGGRVRTVDRGDPDLEEKTHATLSVAAPKDFEIRVPEDVGWHRRRFLVAHELGHYFLHYPKVAPGRMDAAYFDGTRAEWEAEVFAGALLVPTSALRQVYASRSGILVDIALTFGVSVELVSQRCLSSGIQ